MIVQKVTWIPRYEQQDQVVKLLKKGLAYGPFDAPYRILTPRIAPFGSIVLELDFENLAEYDRFWRELFANAPKSYFDEWRAVTQEGGSNEIWDVAE